MATEIERKFLIKSNWFNNFVKSQIRPLVIRQGYLCENENSVRIRIIENKAFITIKSKTSNIKRYEFEYEIPFDDSEILLDMCIGFKIEKLRYILFLNNIKWEIDEFLGVNENLLIAEVELKSIDEEILIPEWILKDVTSDIRYYNAYLSQKPYKMW